MNKDDIVRSKVIEWYAGKVNRQGDIQNIKPHALETILHFIKLTWTLIVLTLEEQNFHDNQVNATVAKKVQATVHDLNFKRFDVNFHGVNMLNVGVVLKC
jgi:hypothetical protein